MDWNGMERNMFLFSHYVTNIYAYAWTCVLCNSFIFFKLFLDIHKSIFGYP